MEISVYKSTKHFRLRSATAEETEPIYYKKPGQLMLDQLMDNVAMTYMPIAHLSPKYEGVGYNMISIDDYLFIAYTASELRAEIDELKNFADNLVL